MKKLLIAGIVLFVAVWVMAQTFSPPSVGSTGPIATSPSQCPTSPAHGFSLCPVETGAGTGTLYISINGSAPSPLQATPLNFTATATTLSAGSPATVSLQGNQFTFGIPAGATGANGATGAQGPQGIPGIPQAGQSFSQKCPVFTINGGTTTSIAESGCTATVP